MKDNYVEAGGEHDPFAPPSNAESERAREREREEPDGTEYAANYVANFTPYTPAPDTVMLRRIQDVAYLSGPRVEKRKPRET